MSWSPDEEGEEMDEGNKDISVRGPVADLIEDSEVFLKGSPSTGEPIGKVEDKVVGETKGKDSVEGRGSLTMGKEDEG